MRRVARLFLRRRKAALWTLVALTGVATLGLLRLRVDDQPMSVFRSRDAEFARLERVFAEFGNDDGDCLVVVRGADPFTPDGNRALRRLTDELRGVDGVARVVSLLDLPAVGGLLPYRPLVPPPTADPERLEAAREAARAHPLGAGQLLSEDGEVTLVVARFGEPDLPVGELRRRVEGVREVVEAANARGEVRAGVTGVPALRVVIFDSIRREQTLLSGLGALVGFLAGVWIFRRPGPVLVTCVASLLSAYWALGTMGLTGEPVNLFNTELPLLILVIAFTDAVHLMIDMLRHRRGGSSAHRAGAHAIRNLGVACALTSLTTAIGFGSLGFSRIEAIREFGLTFAGAVGMTFLVVLTVVPLFGGWVLRGPLPAHGLGEEGRFGPLAERFARGVVRHARPIAAIGVLGTLGLAALSLRLVPENRLTESTPRGNEAAELLGELERHFGGAVDGAVLVEWDPARRGAVPGVLADVERVLLDSDFAHGPLSVRSLAALAPALPFEASVALLPEELTRRLWRPDLGRALVSCRMPDAGSEVADGAYQRLERDLAAVAGAHDGFEVALTGTGYLARRNVNLIIRDFAVGLWAAAIAIFLVLSIAFRSLRLGLITVLPNAFPLAAAGAALVLLGLQLQISSVLAFTVCLGIAVDDTIHYVSCYQRERRLGRTREDAAVVALRRVGKALMVTTVVLMASWCTLFLSDIPTTVLFGAIAALGLAAALVGDLVLLPALVVLFDRGD